MTWGTALGENKEEHSKCPKGDRELVHTKLVWCDGLEGPQHVIDQDLVY